MAAILLVFLEGCSEQAPKPEPVGLTPDASGLQPAGTPLRIDFGRAEAGVIAAVTRLKGAPPARVAELREACRTAIWADGLELHFVDGSFLGWVLDDAAAGDVCA